MTQFWRALASYARVAATTIITATIAMGHIPDSGADFTLIGKAALLALLPVILRALNPRDPAYGIGFNPRA